MDTIVKVDKKPAKKKEKKLTPRERLLIKYLASGMTQKDALIKVGYSEMTASKAAKDILGKPRLQTAMQRAMEKAGVTDDLLGAKLKDGLEANKVISATVIHKSTEGKTEQIDDFIEVPDHQARTRYQDMAHKLRGDYPDSKVDVNHSGTVDVNIDIVKYTLPKGLQHDQPKITVEDVENE